MIWTDRAGLGLWAIAVIVLALLFFGGQLETFRPAPSIPAQASGPFADLDKLPGGVKPRLLTGIEVGLYASRDQRADAFDLAHYVALMTTFVALPAWLVLRIFGFVLGGPMRRKARWGGN